MTTTIDFGTALQLIHQPDKPELSIEHPGEQHWVLVLEAALTAAGFAPGRCTDDGFEVVGHFNDHVQRQVEAFQTHHGLGATGVVGRPEWELLERELTAYMARFQDQIAATAAPRVVETFSGTQVHALPQDELEALRFLWSYHEWREGRLQPTAEQLHAFQLAESDPGFRARYEQALADQYGSQLGMHWDSTRGQAMQRTNADQAAVERYQHIDQGGQVHRGSFLGGMAYSTAKSFGATEEQALAAGAAANTLWGMADAHYTREQPKAEHAGQYLDEPAHRSTP